MGHAAVRALVQRPAALPDCRETRLSYHPDNTPAARLCTTLGFRPTGDFEDEEVVAAPSLASDVAGRPTCWIGAGEIRGGVIGEAARAIPRPRGATRPAVRLRQAGRTVRRDVVMAGRGAADVPGSAAVEMEGVIP